MATLESEMKKRVGKKVAVIFSKDHSRTGVIKSVSEDYLELQVSAYQETDTMFIRTGSIDIFYEYKNA